MLSARGMCVQVTDLSVISQMQTQLLCFINEPFKQLFTLKLLKL